MYNQSGRGSGFHGQPVAGPSYHPVFRPGPPPPPPEARDAPPPPLYQRYPAFRRPPANPDWARRGRGRGAYRPPQNFDRGRQLPVAGPSTIPQTTKSSYPSVHSSSSAIRFDDDDDEDQRPHRQMAAASSRRTLATAAARKTVLTRMSPDDGEYHVINGELVRVTDDDSDASEPDARYHSNAFI